MFKELRVFSKIAPVCDIIMMRECFQIVFSV